MIQLDPEIYLSDNYLVLDIETTNIDKGDPLEKNNSLLLSCYKGRRRRNEVRVKWGNEWEVGSLLRHLEGADFLVAHGAKFELGWLRRCGLDLSKVLVFDTLIAEYIINSNQRKPLDLDSCAERYGLGGKESYVAKLIKGGVCPSEIPKQWLKNYCVQDVVLCEKLFLLQREILLKNLLLPTMLTRCLLTPALTDIEKNGMCLDDRRVFEKYEEEKKEYEALKSDFSCLTGGINFRSPKQVGELLYEKLGFNELRDRRGNPIRTDAGKPCTGKDVIAQLKASNKQQRTFLKLFARLAKKKTRVDNYLEKFKACIEEDGGILYGQFNQTVTKTQRLSSSGKKYKIQFQNFDRTFKPMFKARREGWLIGEGDERQLEFRVAGFLGCDEQAYTDVREDADIHQFTADIMQCSRQEAKAHTFKPLYGGQSGTKTQLKYYEAFKKKYKGVAETQKQWVNETLDTGKLVTATGLVFYWPDTKMTSTGYITNTTKIYNAPVQSFATAEIAQIALLYQWHRMKEENMESFIVNAVHDSTITEVKPEEKDRYEEIVKMSFTTDVVNYLKKVYNIDFDMPLEAEIKLTRNWGEQ